MITYIYTSIHEYTFVCLFLMFFCFEIYIIYICVGMCVNVLSMLIWIQDVTNHESNKIYGNKILNAYEKSVKIMNIHIDKECFAF